MKRLSAILNGQFRQFNTTTPKYSLRDALYQMSCENLDYLIVQEEAAFVGILSEQEVAHKLFCCNRPLEELRVKDIMNTAIPVGSVNDDIDFSIRLLAGYNSRYIAVFDELEFRGIVSETDLLKHSITRMPAERAAPVLQEAFQWSY